MASFGRRGRARHGTAWHGEVRRGRRGTAGFRWAWQDVAGMDRQGRVGWEGTGMAGMFKVLLLLTAKQ